MKTSLFDFSLPDSLIASCPASPRDSARMLVVGESLEDRIIRELPAFLKPNDILVFNDTRVIPARLFGSRGDASIELLLHKRITSSIWHCFARPGKKLRVGDTVQIAADFSALVVDKLPNGQVVLQFDDGHFEQNLQRYGHMPLPPYIKRDDTKADRDTYQTLYAKHDGSVAAPTAGLHFTPELMDAIDSVGCQRAYVTLHVGGGTFMPVKVDDTEQHVMHSEYAEISEEAAAAINHAKSRGGRVFAVGTTSLRTLESAANEKDEVHTYANETDIFITPGYRFKIVDGLLTNFHLPRSTLFMLVSAFAGLGRMQAAYRHAIEQNYRFYSYGDACLLFRS